MFYVLAEPETTQMFIITDDECVPKAFETESAAIDAAKEYSATCLILRPVARVTERITHKVEKIK